MPARLAIEPTLRSKSPIAITIVMPEATTASMLICWEMLSRLRPVRNVSGRWTQKKTMTIATPASVPCLRTSAASRESSRPIAEAQCEQARRRERLGGDDAGEPPVDQDGDAIAERDEFLIDRKTKRGSPARARKLAQQGVVRAHSFTFAAVISFVGT